jgi:transglutaminase/protease-like cytokinesis protein 3
MFLMATLKLVFGLAAFGLVILVGIKVIPPYFSNYQFQDAVKTEALQSTYTSRSEEDIRTAIVKQAHSYDIELTDKQVHVTRLGSGIGTGTIAIDCEYSVPLELPGYSTDLEFHVSSKNRGIY